MTDVLNEFDKALHDAIHASMLKADPATILNNPRIQVPDIAAEKVGNVFGTVADVGCGSGYLSIYIASKYPDVEAIDAIDASEVAVKQVIPRNADYHRVSEKVIPSLGSFDELTTEKYDFVFAMGALHHSRDLRQTLLSISRSLKKGGYLVAQEPAMADDTTHEEFHKKYNIIEERFGLKIRNGDRFDRFFRECEYKSDLVKSGFDILLWDTFEAQPIESSAAKPQQSTPPLTPTAVKTNQANKPQLEPWRMQMREALVKADKKIFIAQKTTLDAWYHEK